MVADRKLPLLALAALLSAASPVAGQRPVAITDVSVLAPDAGSMLPEHTVLLRGDRILAVGPVDEVVAPRRARILDGRGRYLIPGLTDTHVHIKRSRSDVEQLFSLFLDYGVTAVLNLDGGPQVLALRQEVENGDLVGPAIFTSGPILRGGEGMTRADGERLAREQIDAGYDMIKVYNGVTEQGYRGVVEVARARETPVIGHAVRDVGLLEGIAHGQHIAHMEEVVYGYFTWRGRPRSELPTAIEERLAVLLDRSEIPALAKQVVEAGVFVIPNLIAYRQIATQLEDHEAMLARPDVQRMPEHMVRSWQKDRNGYFRRENPERFSKSLQLTYPFLEELTASFGKAGVPLLAGSDVGIPMVLAGLSLHEELELLVEAGLTPSEALRSATTTAAEFLGRPDAGRIAAGQVADLVLLRENPLEDIRNTRSIDRVVLRGRLIDRASTDR